MQLPILQKQMAPGIPASKRIPPTINCELKSKVAITLGLQLCSICCTALQTCKKLLCWNLVAKESADEKQEETCAPTINYTLKALRFYLCSAHCTALQTNNSIRNFLATNPCRFRKSQWEAIANRHLALSLRRTGTKEDKGSTRMLAM